MKKIMAIAAIIGAIGWYGNHWYQEKGGTINGIGLSFIMMKIFPDKKWDDQNGLCSRLQSS